MNRQTDERERERERDRNTRSRFSENDQEQWNNKPAEVNLFLSLLNKYR
jgi:hypothetical protein